jgi:D-arabinose 1-dehydrogenase-like Zn-dependent alcohol dehydrogenase
MPFFMGAVLRNIEIKGSTMGSRKEFSDMVEFVKVKKIRPVVSRVAQGLDIEAINGLFEDMKNGSQFGKLVVDITGSDQSSKL